MQWFARRARCTNPGSPPLYEHDGKPRGSTVAKKNMSRASMNALSSSSIEINHDPLFEPVGKASCVKAILQRSVA
jgi:hypothetical protein